MPICDLFFLNANGNLEREKYVLAHDPIASVLDLNILEVWHLNCSETNHNWDNVIHTPKRIFGYLTSWLRIENIARGKKIKLRICYLQVLNQWLERFTIGNGNAFACVKRVEIEFKGYESTLLHGPSTWITSDFKTRSLAEDMDFLIRYPTLDEVKLIIPDSELTNRPPGLGPPAPDRSLLRTLAEAMAMFKLNKLVLRRGTKRISFKAYRRGRDCPWGQPASRAKAEWLQRLLQVAHGSAVVVELLMIYSLGAVVLHMHTSVCSF
ncbi:hypothetical protein EK21DRAFT_111570 [Setomelanomma holmii]|uniref:Uncharacterized protein n=1 Tax=Setomelanomma holmii TaxID=210430 RepID=A0A9P4HB02_9PLEO|nr:hypothetical protein EK21DRAFT_111570 [Setomelanomma holmii]